MTTLVDPRTGWENAALIPSTTGEETLLSGQLTNLGILWASNKTSGTHTITVIWNDGTTDYTLLEQGSVPANGTAEIDFSGITVRSDQSIKVIVSVANSIHIVMTHAPVQNTGT